MADRTNSPNLSIPVITIDGLAGTGKGTARMRVAARLGFNEHDSGVLFRALGLVCHEKGIPLTEMERCGDEAAGLNVVVHGEKILIDDIDRTKEIRSDVCAKMASAIAKIDSVHQKLRDYQLKKRTLPGLVADGRDQGFIFDTPHRFILTARPEVRAKRRVIEFSAAGLPADYEKILGDIIKRDESDLTRAVQPYIPHPKAFTIDTSDLTRDEVADAIVNVYKNSQTSSRNS